VSERLSGIGLSLMLAKGMIENLNGSLSLLSNEKEKTVFKILIPYQEGNENEDDNFVEFDWSDKTFLIADDEELNRIFIRECIEKTGCNMIFAKNGREAIDLFVQNNNIDIVLMDMKMPEIDGYEATKLIKQHNSSVIVIANTAYALQNDEAKCIEAGCDNYIVKPFTNKEIIELICKYIK